jgi:hypothetical protein
MLAEAEAHEHHIYGDDREAIWAVVDADDYAYFSAWRWEPISNSTGKKFYLRRSVGRGNTSRPLYLHVAIHQRRGITPPSPKHTMVDHIDCDSLNCRKSNLRWATPSMNRLNRHGQREFVW